MGQVGQGFGQTRPFRSHLSRPAWAKTGAKGVRQAGIRLNRLTQMVARLSHPYHTTTQWVLNRELLGD